jgi:hypothetical protein
MAQTALFRESVDAFLGAEQAYRSGAYQKSSQILEAFWALHPQGTQEWSRAMADARSLAASKGSNFGTPACYSALRMLTECVVWRLRAAGGVAVPERRIRLTVVLVGHSSGIQPASLAELRQHSGREVSHSLDASLAAHTAEFLDQSTFLFTEYIRAITGGRLRIERAVLPLPDLDVPVEAVERSLDIAGGARDLWFAGLAPGAVSKIWQAIPDAVLAKTDWWWVLYPSHVPEQFPDFAGKDFITGGMGLGPDGVAPAFLIDDRWLVRVPPHLGFGEYTEAERRAYLPQWLQHEFFHHLYRTYPVLQLETVSHQWFDRQRWPPDFEGLLEADYYAESVHRRLQAASPPLDVALRYAPPPKELFAKIAPAMLRGKYRCEPLLNKWLEGVIDGDAQLRWTNAAGVSWALKPDLKNGVLETDADNPYYYRNPADGRSFRIVLRRGSDGDYLPEVAGFRFQGVFYARISSVY